jgi:hypothetical protein
MIEFTFKTVGVLFCERLKKLEGLRVDYETNHPHPGLNRQQGHYRPLNGQ